jgi:hypothetical protein
LFPSIAILLNLKSGVVTEVVRDDVSKTTIYPPAGPSGESEWLGYIPGQLNNNRGTNRDVRLPMSNITLGSSELEETIKKDFDWIMKALDDAAFVRSDDWESFASLGDRVQAKKDFVFIALNFINGLKNLNFYPEYNKYWKRFSKYLPEENDGSPVAIIEFLKIYTVKKSDGSKIGNVWDLFEGLMVDGLNRKINECICADSCTPFTAGEVALINYAPEWLNELNFLYLMRDREKADAIFGNFKWWQWMVSQSLTVDQYAFIVQTTVGEMVKPDDPAAVPPTDDVINLWVPQERIDEGAAAVPTARGDVVLSLKSYYLMNPRRKCPEVVNTTLDDPRGQFWDSEAPLPAALGNDPYSYLKQFTKRHVVDSNLLTANMVWSSAETTPEYIKEMSLEIKETWAQTIAGVADFTVGFLSGIAGVLGKLAPKPQQPDQEYKDMMAKCKDFLDENESLVASIIVESYTDWLFKNLYQRNSNGGVNFDGVATTIVDNFKAHAKSYCTNYIYKILLQNAENKLRTSIIEQLKNAIEKDDPNCRSDLPPEDKNLIDDAEKQALNEGTGDPDPALRRIMDKTSVEEIKSRQKFFKQCALMRNLQRMKNEFEERQEDYVKQTKKPPFDGRFYMAQSDKDQGLIINNLITGTEAAEWFEIPPNVLSSLVPQLRLYKVEEGDFDNLTETEFVLPQSTDLDKQKNFTNPISPDSFKTFLSADFDKGDGMGLKSFSITLNGSNPATARKDIQARLSLYFQSFGDFLKERISYDGRQYRFVDLIIQPVPNEEGTVNNIEVIHPNQYDPSFYRIRAQMGYALPSDEEFSKLASKNYTQSDLKKLKQAIIITNQSYYLNAVDHDIQVRPDGSVEVNIEYQAYQETALKSPRFDALSTPQIIKKMRENYKNFNDLLRTGKCSSAKLQEFKSGMSAQEAIMKKQSLQSIIRRLMIRKRIYNCKIVEANAIFFRNNGYFKDCVLERTSEYESCADTSVANAARFILTSDSLPTTDDFDFTDKKDLIIQYFYFGDLLYTIMDTMFTSINGDKPTHGAQNFKFILGSFDLDAFGTQVKGVNIATIPISLEYFMSWFSANVIEKGNTRKQFPIIEFVRNLSNNLMRRTLIESCSNVALVKNLAFQTGQILAANPGKKNIFEQEKVVGWSGKKANLYIKCGDNKSKVLPLAGASTEGDLGLSIEDFTNYTILDVMGSNLTRVGEGNYARDIENGRFHLHIGSNRGIVKNISFSKTDIQYNREARFLQHGIDGLLQLSQVYKANVKMFGNTIFYPGMEFYINPYGLGGTILGSPTQGGTDASIANKLGFGGYHTIINIRTTLTPGKFETDVEALWYYSGDGSSADSNGGTQAKPATTSIAVDPSPAFCNAAILTLEEEYALIKEGDYSTTDLEKELGLAQHYSAPPSNNNVTITSTETNANGEEVDLLLEEIEMDVEFEEDVNARIVPNEDLEEDEGWLGEEEDMPLEDEYPSAPLDGEEINYRWSEEHQMYYESELPEELGEPQLSQSTIDEMQQQNSTGDLGLPSDEEFYEDTGTWVAGPSTWSTVKNIYGGTADAEIERNAQGKILRILVTRHGSSSPDEFYTGPAEPGWNDILKELFDAEEIQDLGGYGDGD